MRPASWGEKSNFYSDLFPLCLPTTLGRAARSAAQAHLCVEVQFKNSAISRKNSISRENSISRIFSKSRKVEVTLLAGQNRAQHSTAQGKAAQSRCNTIFVSPDSREAKIVHSFTCFNRFQREGAQIQGLPKAELVLSSQGLILIHLGLI